MGDQFLVANLNNQAAAAAALRQAASVFNNHQTNAINSNSKDNQYNTIVNAAIDQHRSNLVSGWGSAATAKALADCVKESSNPWSMNNHPQLANHLSSTSASTLSALASATSIQVNSINPTMPWAAAVSKSPPSQRLQRQQQQQHLQNSSANNNNFDYGGTIGSWTPPDTSSSLNRNGGWNAGDGSSKSDAIFDDGTAIWGNPTTKKTGIDWTEKESKELANNNVNDLEKHVQKAEPSISSINGTEAWGAPQQPISKVNDSQAKLNNDTSGNSNFGTNETVGWGGELSSLLRATSLANNQNSSPPTNPNSVWNNLALDKQQNQKKSSDWLGSSSKVTNNVGRLEELAKHQRLLETATNLFDSLSLGKNSADSQSPSAIGLGGGGLGGGNLRSVGVVGSAGNHINDHKHINANYQRNLVDPPNRHSGGPLTSGDQQSQYESAAYLNNGNTLTAPSRDLLKQMVHQIQLAVQAGHLNAQILNQPMSTPTLQLVYDLLQQIKALHHVQEIQQQAGIVKSDMGPPTGLDVQINRIRQNISLLQKAIIQQQTADTKNELVNSSSMMKQKQQQQPQQQQQQQKANNYSYATISKLSTNQKVPPQVNNTINSNIGSFNRSSLIDTFSYWSNDTSNSSNDQEKRNHFGQMAGNSASPSALSGSIGLSLQSNQWMFPQGNIGGSLMENLSKISNGSNVKSDNGHATLGSEKVMVGGDPLNKSNTLSNTQARSLSSSLFDWSSMAAPASAIQYKNSASENDNSSLAPGSSSGSTVVRPGPPPGLLNTTSIGQQQHQQQSNVNDMNSLFDVEDKLQSRDSSSSLWGGAWLD